MRRVTPHNKKPNYSARIDWLNPLAVGLEHLYISYDEGIFDLVTNNYISNPTSSAVSTNTKDGVMRDFDGSALSYDAIESKDRRFHTIGGIHVIDDMIANDCFIGLGASSGSAQGRIQIVTTAASSTLKSFCINDAFSGAQPASTATVTTNEVFTFSTLVDDSACYVKLNNNPISTAANRGSGASTINRVAFGGMQRSSASLLSDTKTSLVWLYDRVLSAEELASLHDNPYQLFEPIVRYTGLTVGAAPPAGGRIMSSLTNHGGLAGHGGIAGIGGGLAG